VEDKHICQLNLDTALRINTVNLLSTMPSCASHYIETPPETDTTRNFQVVLEGRQEVPPIQGSRATATAFLSFDTATNRLSGTVSFSCVPRNDKVTMVHLQQEVAGKNGPIIVIFDPALGRSDTYEVRPSDAKLTAAQAAALLCRGTYLNVHTRTYPMGLLRGQVGY